MAAILHFLKYSRTATIAVNLQNAQPRPENNKLLRWLTVKILKIGTPEIITIIVLQLEQLDFTVHYCVQKMQTE